MQQYTYIPSALFHATSLHGQIMAGYMLPKREPGLSETTFKILSSLQAITQIIYHAVTKF